MEWGWSLDIALPTPNFPQTSLISVQNLPSRLKGRLFSSQLLQVLGLALFLTLGTLVILIFPPMFFSHVEGWSFREGFYFAFITLSTIGFGDYVVGENGITRLSWWAPAGIMNTEVQLREVGYFCSRLELLVASSEISGPVAITDSSVSSPWYEDGAECIPMEARGGSAL